MSELAIHTPRGRANEVHNEKCWDVLMGFLISANRFHLHDAHPADGIVRRPNGQPLILVEVKSRHDFDEDEFWRRHKGEWLMTNSKIVDNVPIAKSLGVPFAGAMHIVRSKVILVKAIYNGGAMARGIYTRRTETQATINGGRAVRENAFIPMHDAKRLTYQ